MYARPFALTLTLLTLACGDAPGTTGDSSDSSTGSSSSGSSTSEPTTAGPPPTLAELAACDEADLQPIPWMGPGFDPETGAPRMPLSPPYVVATTVGWYTPDNEEALNNHTTPAFEDVLTRDGLLGVSLALSPGCGSARTLTLWRDEAALMMFVVGKVHSASISGGLQYTLGWETTHWTETAATTPPTWATARAKLEVARGS